METDSESVTVLVEVGVVTEVIVSWIGFITVVTCISEMGMETDPESVTEVGVILEVNVSGMGSVGSELGMSEGMGSAAGGVVVNVTCAGSLGIAGIEFGGVTVVGEGVVAGVLVLVLIGFLQVDWCGWCDCIAAC